MTCPHCEERIVELVWDERLGDEQHRDVTAPADRADIEAHLARSPDCAAALGEFRRIEQLSRIADRHEPPAAVLAGLKVEARKLVAASRADARSQPRPRPAANRGRPAASWLAAILRARIQVPLWATGLALLVAVAGTAWLRQASRGQPSPATLAEARPELARSDLPFAPGAGPASPAPAPAAARPRMADTDTTIATDIDPATRVASPPAQPGDRSSAEAEPTPELASLGYLAHDRLADGTGDQFGTSDEFGASEMAPSGTTESATESATGSAAGPKPLAPKAAPIPRAEARRGRGAESEPHHLASSATAPTTAPSEPSGALAVALADASPRVRLAAIHLVLEMTSDRPGELDATTLRAAIQAARELGESDLAARLERLLGPPAAVPAATPR